jgi:hypothetical protein
MNKMPYNVLRHRDWDHAPRDPVTIGTAIITGLGGSAAVAATTVAFGITVAGIVGYVATSLVTSWALKALSPKPPEFSSVSINSSRGLLVNQKDAIAPHDFVYGEVRKGGAITYYETTGTDNKFLHQIIVLAGHEVDAINDIYINDEVVTLDGSGFVTSAPWASKIRIKKHLGSASQAVDPNLLAESGQINSNFRGRGIAYIYVRFEYDQDVFANGLPLITAVVRGKKVFDPRTTSTAYSNNAALVVRDYLTSAYGLNDSDIDNSVFSAAANISDENVSLSGGGTEDRYTINGVIRAAQSHGDVLQDMMTACAGSLFWGAGKWKLVVGDYIAPTKVLTLNDLRGPISLATRSNVRDQFNGVQGTFNDASQRWITTDYPSITSSTFQAEDGGEESLLDFPLVYTTSAATAQRIAKLTLFRGREQMTISADFGLNAFDVEVGEIIAFTNPRYGFDEKEFEVVGWAFGAAEAGDLRVTLTLRETSEAAFDWNAEESALIQNNTSLPTFTNVGTVGITLDAELRIVNEQVLGVLLIDVTTTSPFIEQFEVQYKRSSDANYVNAGAASGNRYEAIGIADGLYDVRARGINSFGYRGGYTTIPNWTASIFAAPPQDVTNFSANVVGNTLHLSWLPVADLDLSHYKVRYSSQTSGAEYQRAIDVVKKVSRPANTVSLPAQTGTYFLKAVDKLANSSVNPAVIVVSTNIADIDGLNVVASLPQHTGFTGTKTNVILDSDGFGNYITIDPAGLPSNGIYDFDNYVDLGAKYLVRVETSALLGFIDYVNDFDSPEGLFDSRSGLFDGDPSAFDTTSVRTQVSYTDDDPSGSPTWSTYRDFIVGDIDARAIRFRAVLETANAGNAPFIRELTAKVDVPDRVESESDITYTGSTSITFPNAFKETPSIGIAATLADGDRYVISGKSRTGFTITTYTGASVSTNSTTIDYVAKGYGKELT